MTTTESGTSEQQRIMGLEKGIESPSSSAKNVIRLGWISFFNDLGSETITRLIPLYVAGVLGASMTAVGTIEGIADATAVLLKPIFGSMSDRLRKRKPFVIWGYSLSAAVRPLLALADQWPGVAFLRFLDRLGKGVRTSPRDALIAESSKEGRHGISFGINRSLDTFGAVLGVSAFAFWAWRAGENALTARAWIGLTLACSVPGLISVGLATFGIRDPASASPGASHSPSQPGASRKERLNPVFKRYLVVIALFSLANSSDAFILLRARELGYHLLGILGVVTLLNLVSAMTAIPAAALSDRFGRKTLIAAGWTIYALSYGLLGSGYGVGSAWVFGAIVATYGLFYGFTESVERAWIADLIPGKNKGRAYGVFGLVVGVSAFPASLGFGWIWDHYGSPVAFLCGSALALFATGLLFVLVPAGIIPARTRT